MKLMISAREVIEIAFAGTEHVREELISETRIELAQQRFLKPALGGLYNAVAEGKYPDLLFDYLKAPLALYVKYLILPELSAQATSQGVVQYKNEHMTPASATTLALARRKVRNDARILLDRALTHIVAHPECYPEFDSVRDAAIRTSMRGGIILK